PYCLPGFAAAESANGSRACRRAQLCCPARRRIAGDPIARPAHRVLGQPTERTKLRGGSSKAELPPMSGGPPVCSDGAPDTPSRRLRRDLNGSIRPRGERTDDLAETGD